MFLLGDDALGLLLQSDWRLRQNGVAYFYSYLTSLISQDGLEQRAGFGADLAAGVQVGGEHRDRRVAVPVVDDGELARKSEISRKVDLHGAALDRGLFQVLCRSVVFHAVRQTVRAREPCVFPGQTGAVGVDVGACRWEVDVQAVRWWQQLVGVSLGLEQSVDQLHGVFRVDVWSMVRVVGGSFGSGDDKVSFSEVVTLVRTAKNNVHSEVVEIGWDDVIKTHGDTCGWRPVKVPHVQVVFLVAPGWGAQSRVVEHGRGGEVGGFWNDESSTVTGVLSGRGHHNNVVAGGFEVSVESSDVGCCPSIVVGDEDVFGGGSNERGCESEKSSKLHE
ncbi:hypothetical protein OGAPHI_005837 [Ogataea philodendri]|uniref:Uncharacterized protein n=1 Tax=Ogataea philodendri TaxID=1378263 RepID=A0A9P8T242_9ASCO|nr:uncharacterized protein OGAPHI_005837 [Ogataea philodendri]KAH3662585.1 hypothetical protein OGAPHI_005837 [Ogataea philodendri]